MRWIVLFGLSLMLIGFSPEMSQANSSVRDLGAEAMNRINVARAKKGRGPLRVSDKLTQAAARHARDMAEKRYFSHTGSDGSEVGDRVNGEGYGYCLVAENIAKGQGNLIDAMRGWMNSRGHRRNILQKRATEFGLVRGADNIWVMVLGRPGC